MDRNSNSNERLHNERKTTASLVHRRNLDGSIWSATRLTLPDLDATRLEIVHSLVLGEDTDPFFFNEDYSVAASTGLTKVWDGAWTVLNLLLQQHQQQQQQPQIDEDDNVDVGNNGNENKPRNNDDNNSNNRTHTKWLLAQDCLRPNSVIVELGSGSGLVGLVAACLGAHVLLTDVPTVVENALEPNIEKNATSVTTTAPTSSPWPGARPIGKGTIACAPFDWRRVSQELDWNLDFVPLSTPANVILAVECLWLKDLLKPFVTASLALLNAAVSTTTKYDNEDKNTSSTVMYMCTRERAKSDSKIFCSPNMAVDAFREAGCEVTLILEEEYQELLPRSSDGEVDNEEILPVGPVQLFRILPPSRKRMTNVYRNSSPMVP